MGVASLIIGAMSFLGGLIPLMGLLFIAPALVGLALGIIDAVFKTKKNMSKSIAVWGMIVCAFDVIGIIGYYFMFLTFFPFS